MSKKDKKGVDKQKSKWYPLEAVSEGNKKTTRMTEKNKKTVDKSRKTC